MRATSRPEAINKFPLTNHYYYRRWADSYILIMISLLLIDGRVVLESAVEAMDVLIYKISSESGAIT